MNDEEIELNYNNVNIERCLELLFPPAFNSSDIAAIAKEILRLIELLKPQYKAIFYEHPFIISAAQKRIVEPSSSLNAVLDKIKQAKCLGLDYLPAFICSTLERSSYNHEKFQQYKALTFVVAIRLLMMGQHSSAVKTVCDEVRQFAVGKRERLAAWLPDVFTHSFSSLIDELESLREETEAKSETKQVSQQLAKYHVPYRDSYQLKDGITRNVSSREFNKHGVVFASSTDSLDDESDTSVIELHEIRIKPNVNEDWQHEDAQTGQTRTHHQVTFQSHTPERNATDALQAKAIVERLVKKKMSLPCDIYLASSFEIKVFIKKCVQAIKQDHSETAKLLLYMLLFGNQSSQVRQMKPLRDKQAIIGVKRYHTLPSQKIRSEIEPLVKSVSTILVLPVPELISLNIKSFKFKNVTDEDIAEFIKTINQTSRVHITLTKVTGFLTSKLKQEGVDPVLIELIKGSAPNELAALSYTQLDTEVILSTFKRYVRFLTVLSGCDELTLAQINTENQLIGSPLAIEPSLLKRLFSAIISQLNALNTSKGAIFTVTYHNLVTVYTAIVLALSSGYRPVTGWLGKLTDINLTTGHYWISDKENLIGDASRVVILPKLACKCLEQYLAYLEKAAFQVSNTHRSLYLRYQDAISGQGHLCFFRTDTGWSEVSPKTLAPIVDPIFPLQPNWHRHHIRSLLFNEGVHSDLIAAWMGHAEVSETPFAQYSCLSSRQLEQIADIIEQHLTSIKVEAVQYG